MHNKLTQETCIQDVLAILKHPLQNLEEIVPRYYTYGVICSFFNHTMVCYPSLKGYVFIYLYNYTIIEHYIL